jgi:alpha-glucosidase
MVDGIIPLEKMQDPQGLSLGMQKSRDPCRTPFHWSADQYAGFSTVEPWLPIAAGFEDCNLAAGIDDPCSILNLYRTLLRLRNDNDALQLGRYRAIDCDQFGCYAYMRFDEYKHYLIVLNFSSVKMMPTLGTAHTSGQIILSTLMDRQEPVRLDALILRPHEGLVMELDVLGVEPLA